MKRNGKEFETQRRDITPRAFFGYVRRELKKRTGVDLDTWVASYEDWANVPLCAQTNTRDKHENWEVPQLEICKTLPFHFQYCLQGEYNLILEFDFWDDKTGFGYCYFWEAEDC